MHVANLVSPPPASPRSDSRPEPSRGSDFGSAYRAEERRPAGGETPPAKAERTEPERPASKDEKQETPREDHQPHDLKIEPEVGEAVRSDLADTDEAPAGAEAAAEAAGGVEGERLDRSEEAAWIGAGETPRSPQPAAEATEPEMPGAASKANATTSTQAAAGAARAVPAADASEDAAPATGEAPATSVSKPAAQTSLPGGKRNARAGADESAPVEQVTVRRVRPEAETAAAEEVSDVRPDPVRREPEKSPKPATILAAPVDMAAKPSAETTQPGVYDPALADVVPAEGRSTAEHAARAESTARHDTPRPVIQQVAEAARALRDGPVELTMQPEELGKVRMTLSTGADGAMILSVQAERPETLDLVRRHIGDLARELQDMGFDNLSFSFGQDRASAERQPQSRGDDDSGEQRLAAIPLARQGFAGRPAQAMTNGGLDLRL